VRLLSRIERGMTFRRATVACAVLATAHALVYLPFTHTHTTADSPTYLAAGDALLHGSYSTPLRANLYYTDVPGGFVDRTILRLPRSVWDAREHQTFRTPGYPLVIAAVGGGSSTASRWLLYLVQAAMLGAVALALVHGLAHLTSRAAALSGGVVYALDPFSKRYAWLVMTEATAALFVALAFYFFARAVRTRSAWSWASAGAAAAAATLARPVFVMLVALLLIAALVFARGRRAASALAMLAASVVVLSPWVAYTTSVVGRPTLATFTEGMALLEGAWGQGLHLRSAEIERDPRFLAEFAKVHRFAPSTHELLTDPDAHARYLDRADAELRKSARHFYGKRLRNEPGEVLWDVAYRAYFLSDAHADWYQPHSLLPLLRLFDWLTLAFAVAGGILVQRRYGWAAASIPLFLLTYALVLAEARFGIPVRSLYLSLVGVALLELYRLWRPAHRLALAD
jgi:4-amino-4-deoxy-L-arabinose transferase-like glycosyltransferase